DTTYRLRRLLRREDRAALEAQALLLRPRHLPHQALEGRLLQEEVRGALELADLAQRHGSRAPAALCVFHARRRARGLGGLLALLGRDGPLAPRSWVHWWRNIIPPLASTGAIQSRTSKRGRWLVLLLF
ncbi:uncharacterized protein Tco025E_03775, partial [Trypanosoma conorhini]